jgi:hypothetical protein
MPPTNPHANQARQNLHEAKRQKASVRVASTTNVSVSSPGATIDGVTMVSGEDVGLFGQTTASQNGLYTWHGAASAMTRRTDASASTDMLAGDQVYVREGTANGGTNWQLKTSAAITLGTTSLTYARIDASSAFTGEVTGTDFKPTGLTGATQASRYVGATASGAPSTGTFLQRDWVVDAAGSIWICTTAGSPGTWTAVGSSIVGFFEVTGTSLFTAQADFSDAVVIQGALTTGGPLSISGGLGLLNGQALAIKSLTELTTIAAAASTLTTIQIPAGAIVFAVSVRVTVAIPTATTFTVTGNTTGTFHTAAVSTAVNSTDKGTAAGAFYSATTQSVKITPNATPASNAGRVRVTIMYLESTPPTS